MICAAEMSGGGRSRLAQADGPGQAGCSGRVVAGWLGRATVGVGKGRGVSGEVEESRANRVGAGKKERPPSFGWGALLCLFNRPCQVLCSLFGVVGHGGSQG